MAWPHPKMSKNYSGKNNEIGKANALHGKKKFPNSVRKQFDNAEVEIIFLVQQKLT